MSNEIAARVARSLADRSLTLATAESCSGGLISHELTNVDGASRWFLGGIVAYSNAVKTALLGVDLSVLETHGAVSEPVARAMAEGVQQRLGADCGIGVTGIAGPTGGTAEKPVGLVYIAVAVPTGTAVTRNVFAGSRLDVKRRTAERALTMLLESIE